MNWITVGLLIYLKGCLIAWLILKFAEYPLTKTARTIGVALSWGVVFYFIYTFNKTKKRHDKIRRTQEKIQATAKDSELVKQVIDGYWLKVLNNINHDNINTRPPHSRFKNMDLCAKYERNKRCIECPISTMYMNCFDNSEVYNNFLKATEETVICKTKKDYDLKEEKRKDAVIECCKVFEHIYNVCKLKESH